jgi:hypothetical protein
MAADRVPGRSRAEAKGRAATKATGNSRLSRLESGNARRRTISQTHPRMGEAQSVSAYGRRERADGCDQEPFQASTQCVVSVKPAQFWVVGYFEATSVFTFRLFNPKSTIPEARRPRVQGSGELAAITSVPDRLVNWGIPTELTKSASPAPRVEAAQTSAVF